MMMMMMMMMIIAAVFIAVLIIPLAVTLGAGGVLLHVFISSHGISSAGLFGSIFDSVLRLPKNSHDVRKGTGKCAVLGTRSAFGI